MERLFFFEIIVYLIKRRLPNEKEKLKKSSRGKCREPQKRNYTKWRKELTKAAKSSRNFVRGFDASEIVSLPFYVCSVGRKVLPANSYSVTGEISNNFVELCWSTSGMGEIDFYGRKFKLAPGDVFYFLPGEAHVMRGLSDCWHSRWLCFEGPLAVAVFMAYGLNRVSHANHFPDELFSELEEKIYDRDPVRIAHLSGILLEILSELALPVRSNTKSLFEQCIDYIRTNDSDPQLSVKTLCDKFNIPQTTLTRMFRQNHLPAPGAYIAGQRTIHANSLLKGSALPVAEIARRCGFQNASSFTRFIRRRVRKSPREIREEPHTGDSSPENTSGK